MTIYIRRHRWIHNWPSHASFFPGELRGLGGDWKNWEGVGVGDPGWESFACDSPNVVLCSQAVRIYQRQSLNLGTANADPSKKVSKNWSFYPKIQLQTQEFKLHPDNMLQIEARPVRRNITESKMSTKSKQTYTPPKDNWTSRQIAIHLSSVPQSFALQFEKS